MPREKLPTFLLATERDAHELEHLVDARARDAIGRRQGAKVVARAAAGMDGLGVEQCADLAQRVAQLGVALALDGGATLDDGWSRPRMMRIVVDLPEPFGPRNPVTTPGCTSKSRSSTASVSR